jgi:hypothetical protein
MRKAREKTIFQGLTTEVLNTTMKDILTISFGHGMAVLCKAAPILEAAFITQFNLYTASHIISSND